MTDIKPEFVYTTYINTTPEKLWKALTNGEFTEKYFFGNKVESSWEKGAKITYTRADGNIDIYGEILEIEPFSKLSYTFNTPDDPNKRESPTKVTFLIKSVDDFVKLTLIHENLIEADCEKNSDTLFGLNNGWPAIISNLKSVIETGKVFNFSSLMPTPEQMQVYMANQKK